jgi:energy-coupling factor transporter ATP-binding protein EcfA2
LLLTDYGLEKALLTRPTIALSGGERLLLSLVKAEILAVAATELVMCSPAQWLFPANYHLLSRVIAAFQNRGKRVQLLLLAGEPSPFNESAEGAVTPNRKSEVSALPWELVLEDSPCVVFPEKQFPYHTAAKQIAFEGTGNLLRLVSPTVCTGPNGVGKSTLGLVLCGCLRLDGGLAWARVAGFRGMGRLVMQMCVEQLFGFSPIEHLKAVFQCDTDRLKAARTIFEELQDAVVLEAAGDATLGVVGDREFPDSILQAKLALAAARLASDAPLLILDEPTHGLSVGHVRAFLRAAIAVAHRRRMAVMIITHMEGIVDGLVNSRLSLGWGDQSRSRVEVRAE